uniref:Orf69b protein n=1 Tax=Cupriavidus metallidurans TaxID=119219 RepID=P94144_9BURK|nr:orf69b [Cupriavidus metallidurans CH34]
MRGLFHRHWRRFCRLAIHEAMGSCSTRHRIMNGTGLTPMEGKKACPPGRATFGSFRHRDKAKEHQEPSN